MSSSFVQIWNTFLCGTFLKGNVVKLYYITHQCHGVIHGRRRIVIEKEEKGIVVAVDVAGLMVVIVVVVV